MEIMSMFGRMLSAKEPAPTKAPEVEARPEVANPAPEVVLRNKRNVVAAAEQSQQQEECRKSYRISLCDFGIKEEEGEEKEAAALAAADEEPVPETISGVDWESANFALERMSCDDEVTAMDASDDYIVLQYHAEPGLDVYDRQTRRPLFRLQGHAYGGQCIRLAGGILYSGSMDKTVRSWHLPEQRPLETIFNHLDYVQSLAVDRAQRWVSTGGRGDKAIFVYETDETGKLWRRHHFTGHEGWVTQLAFTGDGDDDGQRATTLVSGSDDASIRLWDLVRGTLLRVLPQDDAISCLTAVPGNPDLLLFGDRAGKLSYLNLATRVTLHLLPNILIGTGRYSRSGKYHDKAVDAVHLSDNGYMITASAGSKYLKVWRVERRHRDEAVLEHTEVTELQILRDHTACLTTFCVQGSTVLSTCADGQIYLHTFPRGSPHYEMAREQDGVAATAATWSGGLAAPPERPTEACAGPRLCRTGKTGLVRSSSSFQVSFQLQPKVCAVDGRIRVKPQRAPATLLEEDSESESGPPIFSSSSSSSSEYEVTYETETDDDE